MRSDNITRVIPEVSGKYGAPMGRPDRDTRTTLGEFSDGTIIKDDREPHYDKRVPMCTCCGAYDRGGAYWGIGAQLRVQFNRNLTYIHFYRNEQ